MTNIKVKIKILFLLMFGTEMLAFSQTSFFHFSHLELPQSIQSKKVRCFYQDNDGFLWIGMNAGLVRYDGHTCIEIKNANTQGGTRSFRNVMDINEDSKDNIWIACKNGLYIFNRKSELTTEFQKNEIESIEYRTLNVSRTGEIIIGTSNGLRIYEPKKDQYKKYLHQPGLKESISHNIIRCVYEDIKGNLWIGTHDQLNKFDRNRKKFTHYKLQEPDKNAPANNLILSISSINNENDSLLIIGTETGLCLFNTQTEDFNIYSQKNNKTLSNNVIKTTAIVDTNTVWIGTDYGLNQLNISEKKFKSFYHNFENPNSISHNIVHTLYQDRQGNMWIGTQNGVDKIYFPSNHFLFNQFSDKSKRLKGGIEVNAIEQDDNQIYWMATSMGLIKYNPATNNYAYYNPPQILHQIVNDIFIDDQGLVWLATPGGLNVLNPKNDSISSFLAKPRNKNYLQTNYLQTIAGDQSGNIWIGTFDKGLYKFIPDGENNRKFINFSHNNNTPNSISANFVKDILVDKNNHIWVSTIKGLNILNPLQGEFEKFRNSPNDTLHPQGNIYSLFSESPNSIWIAARNGLFKKDPDDEGFIFITKIPFTPVAIAKNQKNKIWLASSDNIYQYSLENDQWSKIPWYKSGIAEFKKRAFSNNKGQLIFNSIEGFISFNPEKISLNSISQNIELTNLKISDITIKPYQKNGKHQVLYQSINKTSKIKLKYDENSFQISFSALNLIDGKNQSYSYILEGYDDEWKQLTDGSNTASYTKVRPGDYIFKVKASNEPGIQNNNTRQLKMEIAPPFWASNWAISFYVLLLISLFFISRRMLTARIQYRNDIRFERLKSEKSEELIELRTQFYNNITHELKTPLSLISGPVDRLISIEDEPQKLKSLKIIKRNAIRLITLVNQILDLRKIEQGKEKLSIQNYDIVRFSYRIFNQFQTDTLQRHIDMKFQSQTDHFYMWFDLEKIEKVLYNLLSNAYKFTPDGEQIRLSVKLHEKFDNNKTPYVEITIADTGSGISDKDKPFIFERFSNINSTNFTNQTRTGIGLSIVRDYVNLHSGKVEFESKINEGSTFKVFLPANKNELKDYIECNNSEKQKNQAETENIVEDNEMPGETNSDGHQTIVLIVEDDQDLRIFLADSFKTCFKVILAENGEQGWNKAVNKVPDLIISDVMMPKMDGFELCEKVKTDLRTCHIPIILLTAKGGSENKLLGIETGADDYVQKPFDPNYLLLRSNKLIQQRNILKKAFLQQKTLEPSEVEVNSLDEKFLNQVVKKIEENMDNSELNVHLLSDFIGMSHISFYRKIKGLTGQTASEFIRNIRIKRAGQLLKTNEFTVKDVMYMVGFTHRSYFSKTFKEHFGVLPKDFK